VIPARRRVDNVGHAGPDNSAYDAPEGFDKLDRQGLLARGPSRGSATGERSSAHVIATL
jgi:hypothetical protein